MAPSPSTTRSPQRDAAAAAPLKARAPRPVERIPPRSGDRSRAPLSSGQQRLWFLHQMAPASPAYNVPVCFRLRGPLDIDVFTQTLRGIVGRHESLRTSFEIQGRE